MYHYRSADIQRIIRECCKQLYIYKFSNLDEVDHLLEKPNYNSSNMKIDLLSNPITLKVIKFISLNY